MQAIDYVALRGRGDRRRVALAAVPLRHAARAAARRSCSPSSCRRSAPRSCSVSRCSTTQRPAQRRHVEPVPDARAADVPAGLDQRPARPRVGDRLDDVRDHRGRGARQRCCSPGDAIVATAGSPPRSALRRWNDDLHRDASAVAEVAATASDPHDGRTSATSTLERDRCPRQLGDLPAARARHASSRCFPLYYTIVMASHTNAEMAAKRPPLLPNAHALRQHEARR